MNPAYEILNVRGRLIALCTDGTIWLFDVPPAEGSKQEREKAINSTGWIQLPYIPLVE